MDTNMKELSALFDITIYKNGISGRQGWAYVCNSGEIPVLRADADIPQEFVDYREFEPVRVKYQWKGKEMLIVGTLAWENDNWFVNNGGCCISSNFGIRDVVDLVNNSQAPGIEEGQTVAIAFVSESASTASLMLFRVGKVDSLCSRICNLVPLSYEEMQKVLKYAETWCDR